jgi:phosphoglycolate phosphatase
MAHLFFDLDGTLTDPAAGIIASLQHALRAMEVPGWSDAELRRFIGPPLREAFHELLATDSAELVERAVVHFRERFGTKGLYENELYAGIPEALGELQAEGFQLCLVTSKAHVYASRILEHFGLADRFAGVYGAELSGERSAKAELIAHALQRERIEASTACMIGDRKHDIEGAKAHQGVLTVGVLWGYGTRDELEGAGADVVVASIAELPAAVRQLRPMARDSL